MLTGERRVLRADVMLDAGNSLSPAIDAGQVLHFTSCPCSDGDRHGRSYVSAREQSLAQAEIYTSAKARSHPAREHNILRKGCVLCPETVPTA